MLLLFLLLLQLPSAQKLSPEDSKGFHDEIRRIERMLETAGDKSTVEYALARTWAAGGQYREAVDWLNKVIARNVGIDPVNDRLFMKLHGTTEFESIMRKVREDTPPIVKSSVAFTIDEADLIPEGIASDPKRSRFYLGSTSKKKIVECDLKGNCRTFASEGLGEVLGMKVDPLDGSLWAASNADDKGALFHYSVPSGKLIRKYSGGRMFNDLAISSKGDVFVTDTREGAVYKIARAPDQLELLDAKLKVPEANGIALSDDGTKLFISTFGNGISVFDLRSGSFHAIRHPENLCLATIDGLSFFEGSLIAIQNGIMANRVARFYLSHDMTEIERFEILERRNPLFDGITTGAIAHGAFYFMANTQDDKKAGFQPIKILKLGLSSASPNR